MNEKQLETVKKCFALQKLSRQEEIKACREIREKYNLVLQQLQEECEHEFRTKETDMLFGTQTDGKCDFCGLIKKLEFKPW